MKEFWFNLSDKIRFLFIGAFNAGVSFLIYSVLILVFGEAIYQIALALSWILSSVVSYTTQRLFVFNIKGNIFKQYFKCCTTWVFSYMINAGVLEVFVKNLHFNVYFAQIAATFVSAIFTYILLKNFAFKRR